MGNGGVAWRDYYFFNVFFGVQALYFRILTAILSSVIITVLLTMRDLEFFRIGYEEGIDESGMEIFDAIGRPRYYNEYNVQLGKTEVPSDLKEYRLGKHLPGEKEDIVVVKQ